MTLDPLADLDLSELPDYDADAEYQALLRALRRQAGFGIIFVRCSPDQGRKLIEQVTRDLPRQRCAALSLTESLPDGDFFALAQQFLAEHPAEVVFVQGLEQSLLDYEETKRQSGWTPAESRSYSWKGVPPILRNLNQQRDRFRNELSAQFVFLVPLFVLKYLRRRAPDFFDWQSGAFGFRDSEDSIAQKVQDCFLEDYEKVQEMDPGERVWQAIQIRDLLEESAISSDKRFRLLIDLGIIQAVEKSFQDVHISWDKALDIDVSNAENLNLRGQILATRDRHEAAIASYDQAVEIKPDYHDAWTNRGNSLANLGRYEAAIASYDRALEIKPDKHEAWTSKGTALENLSRYEDALNCHEKALEIKPDYGIAWYNKGVQLGNLGRYEAAITSYDKVLEIKPDDHEAWTNRGISLKNLGRYEAAISSYDKALEIKPDFHQAWYNRGNSLVNLGRYEEAIASYDKAVAIKPDDHQAWTNRGISLQHLDRHEEAIASYDQAVAIQPDFHQAWNNRGISLRNLGRYEEAIASYEKALEIKPDAPLCWANRGDTHKRLGQSEQALADLNRAIELKPEYDWAIATRGQVYAQLQRYDLALQDLDQALSINPEYAWAMGYRGELYLWLHRYDEALATFNQSLEKDSDDDWTYYCRALALAKLSQENSADLEQAIQLAQAAHEKEPENWYSHFNLALYYLAAGHAPDAQTRYETGLNRAPAWAIAMAYRDLRDYLHLLPHDAAAQTWCQRLLRGC
jgi:superkiller protein 3